ncbi:hypothetical protein [Eubacterium aggregans]|uniref:hypothetical protein n=1 Tax=Eubacterium aggregans TaxID=81409 RepID=UPI003F3E20FF
MPIYHYTLYLRTGLEQAQEYYEKCGRETLARQFPECWERVAAGLVEGDLLRWCCQINTADDCVRVIEKISDRIRQVLLDMGLSQVDSDFLDHHTGAILSRITDDALRRI